MIRFSTKASQRICQSIEAAKTMIAMDEYARSIGCVVRGDEVEATAEQSKLLDAKWKELTR